MKVTLREYASEATENDCVSMLDRLLSFGGEELSQSVQDNIISDVTRKVEAEMNDTQTKPKKRIKRRIITIIIAAALLLPVGAYAAGRLFHKQNVEFYIKGSERIEQNESAVKNYVMENEDFKITIDSQLSDGHNVMQIVTQEGKTSKARDELEYYSGMLFTAKANYADGSDGPHFNNEHDMFYAGGYSNGEHVKKGDSQVVIYSCKGIDIKKDLKLTYCRAYGDFEGVEYTSDQALNDEDIDCGYEELDGFEYTTNFAPNVKSVELKSKDGKKLILSEFEIYSPDDEHFGENVGTEKINGVPTHVDVSQRVSLIKTNGEKYKISEDNKTEALDDHIIFGEIIDPDDFKGVEINGVEYLKQ